MSTPQSYASLRRKSRAGTRMSRCTADATNPTASLPPFKVRLTRPMKELVSGSTSSGKGTPEESTVACAGAVTASMTPTDQPPGDRPDNLAAPRMVVCCGTSAKLPLEYGPPDGRCPIRRERCEGGRV